MGQAQEGTSIIIIIVDHHRRRVALRAAVR
jgi:hypothetical protein